MTPFNENLWKIFERNRECKRICLTDEKISILSKCSPEFTKPQQLNDEMTPTVQKFSDYTTRSDLSAKITKVIWTTRFPKYFQRLLERTCNKKPKGGVEMTKDKKTLNECIHITSASFVFKATQFPTRLRCWCITWQKWQRQIFRVLLFLEIAEFWFAVVGLWPVEDWGGTNIELSQIYPDFLGDHFIRLEHILIF